jgi:phosphoadenosine phosphosulfate reductase
VLLTHDGRTLSDPWRHLKDDDPAPTEVPFTVSEPRWREQADRLGPLAPPKGVRLQPGDAPEDLAAHIDRLDLVVIELPSFKDGRVFTQARLLRNRLRFRGEIRVAGPVVADQFKYLVRCGVDTVSLDDDEALAPWRAALAHQPRFYQSSARGHGLRLRRPAK